MPKLYPTTITVTQNGQPLENASVSLIPEDETGKWAAGGDTDSSGRASLKTQGMYKGVAEGKYKVCVTKYEEDPSRLIAPDPNDKAARVQYARDLQKEKRNTYHLIDPRYGNYETTDIVAEVVRGGNSLSCDVGKSVRISVKKL